MILWLAFVSELGRAWSFVQRASWGGAPRLRSGEHRSTVAGLSLPDFKRSRDQQWDLWPTLPLAPYGYRKTLVTEIVKDRIWSFDQLQGTLYVHVPVRMTVLKRSEGGLICYCPVAPTIECISAMRALEAEHGSVTDIVLPTLGVEHKAFIGPFCRKFPSAKVWFTQGQYSFPLDFKDLSFVGIFRASPIPPDGTPFLGDEFEHATLGPLIPPGNGGFGETALYHRPTRSLLVVDTVVRVGKTPPPIVSHDPRALLFHARDTITDVSTRDDLNTGWQRLSLFAFFFQPSALEVVPFPTAFAQTRSAGMPGVFGWADLYPFEWNPKAAAKSFNTLIKPKLFVAPILRELILNREPETVLEWVDKLCTRFDFKVILPCHLEAKIQASPADFRAAFDFLYDQPDRAFLNADLAALLDAEASLVETGEIYPRPARPPAPNPLQLLLRASSSFAF